MLSGFALSTNSVGNTDSAPFKSAVFVSLKLEPTKFTKMYEASAGSETSPPKTEGSLPGSAGFDRQLPGEEDQSYSEAASSAVVDEERSDAELREMAPKLSVREILRSLDADRDDSENDACGLLAKVQQECDQDVCRTYEGPASLDSATKIAGEIMHKIFKKVTKPKPLRRTKRPVMKSGWMRLQRVIPNFYIDDDMFKNIMFSENLLVSTIEMDSFVPTPVGGLSLDVQAGFGGPLRYQNEKTRGDFVYPKFVVHLSSQLTFMEHNGGSRITAWVDRDLQTLEEKRREYLRLDDKLSQQALYVSSQENFYYLRHDKKKDIFYSPKKAENLICEGSSFVLMRYLALAKFVGTFEATTLYIDGSLCRNIYECKGPSGAEVNNTKLDVCKIFRTIIEECGIEHRSVTLMSLHGQILKQEWHFCDHILHVNPLADLSRGKPTGHDRIPLEAKAFTDDLQVLSLYLDAKTRQRHLLENYMEDHPEIKNLLGDYVQTILQLKPEDVFEFTAKYFLAFTPALLPQSEYFEGPFDEDGEEDYDFWKYI